MNTLRRLQISKYRSNRMHYLISNRISLYYDNLSTRFLSESSSKQDENDNKNVFNWKSKHTLWCLAGCSIGDFGTIIIASILSG